MAQEFDDTVAVRGVELAGGFVGDQHAGAVGRGDGEGDALPLAATEAIDGDADQLGQPKFVEELFGAGKLGVAAVAAGTTLGEADVVDCVGVWEQVATRVLHCDADLLGADPQ